MHVAILADAEFARREAHLLQRLQFGLLDAGVRITSLQPASAPRYGSDLIPTHPYIDTGPPLTRGLRARQAASTMLESDGAEPEIVHAFGPRSWAFAGELAGVLGASLCLEVHSLDGALRASGMRHLLVQRLAHGAEHLWSCADRGLLDRMPAALHARTRLVRWGVPADPVRGPERDEVPGLCIVCQSRPRAGAAAALLEALARHALHAESPPLLFSDELFFAQKSVWRRARLLGLLDRLTVVPDLPSMRDLVLRCGGLVLPAPTGTLLGIELEALAAGVPLLARRDIVPELPAGAEDVFVDGDDADAWAAGLERVFGGGAEATAPASERTARIRDAIRALHRPATHVEETLTLYEELSAAPAIRFST